MNDIPVFSNALDGVDEDLSERLLPLETFDLFDPLTGAAPRAFPTQFENIIQRARALLPGWNASQVMEAADYLAFLLWATPATAPQASEEPARQLGMEAREYSIAQAAATWARYDASERVTDDTRPLDQPYWPGIFTCYALAHVGLAHHSCAYAQPVPAPAPDSAAKERFIVDSNPSLGAWPLASAGDLSRETVALVAMHAFAALEAVCSAEALVSSERKIATEKSAHAMKASAAKHAKTQALKRRVKALYKSDPDFAATKMPPLSNQRVADIIYDHLLTDEERSVLSGRYPSQTIAKWIADFRIGIAVT